MRFFTTPCFFENKPCPSWILIVTWTTFTNWEWEEDTCPQNFGNSYGPSPDPVGKPAKLNFHVLVFISTRIKCVERQGGNNVTLTMIRISPTYSHRDSHPLWWFIMIQWVFIVMDTTRAKGGGMYEVHCSESQRFVLFVIRFVLFIIRGRARVKENIYRWVSV